MFTIYTTMHCDFCTRAKNLLFENNCEYVNIILDTPEKKKDFKETTGLRTVPQIYTDTGHHIGGYEELKKYLTSPSQSIVSHTET